MCCALIPRRRSLTLRQVQDVGEISKHVNGNKSIGLSLFRCTVVASGRTHCGGTVCSECAVFGSPLPEMGHAVIAATINKYRKLILSLLSVESTTSVRATVGSTAKVWNAFDKNIALVGGDFHS